MSIANYDPYKQQACIEIHQKKKDLNTKQQIKITNMIEQFTKHTKSLQKNVNKELTKC